jgi:hypothetical protein
MVVVYYCCEFCAVISFLDYQATTKAMADQSVNATHPLLGGQSNPRLISVDSRRKASVESRGATSASRVSSSRLDERLTRVLDLVDDTDHGVWAMIHGDRNVSTGTIELRTSPGRAAFPSPFQDWPRSRYLQAAEAGSHRIRYPFR